MSDADHTDVDHADVDHADVDHADVDHADVDHADVDRSDVDRTDVPEASEETAAGGSEDAAGEAPDGADHRAMQGALPLELPGDEGSLGAPSLGAALEAVLMLADEPLPAVELASVLRTPLPDVEAALTTLATEYRESGRGFELREVAGGWRYYSAPKCAAVVERFVLDGQQARLTQAALETLAVVAYRQPVTRGRVSAVRGVNVDGVVRTLVARGLVEEAGHEPESGAVLYRTTSYFLERLGLRSLDDLPPLADHLPGLEALDELHDAGTA